MGDSCSFCQPGSFMADRTTDVCTVWYFVWHRTSVLYFGRAHAFDLFKMKNLPQFYQSCSRRSSGSSGQPVKWSFCPSHLLYLRKETEAGEHCQRPKSKPVLYPISFPHSLWNTAALNARHLPVFNLQTLLSVPQVFTHSFSLGLERFA